MKKRKFWIAVFAMFFWLVFPRRRTRTPASCFIDFLLSKEGQKMLVGFRRIPVREDVDADPPRLFKGYKRVVEHPEDYRNFNETVQALSRNSGDPLTNNGVFRNRFGITIHESSESHSSGK